MYLKIRVKVADGFKNQTLQHCSAVGRAGQVRGQENESQGLNFQSAELVKQKAELKGGSEVQGGDKRGTSHTSAGLKGVLY